MPGQPGESLALSWHASPEPASAIQARGFRVLGFREVPRFHRFRAPAHLWQHY